MDNEQKQHALVAEIELLQPGAAKAYHVIDGFVI
jgi:hypothetical protein